MNLEALRSQSRGEMLTPGSLGYDTSRRIWTKPAAIARCTGPADVQAAVRFAVDDDLFPAVRTGGYHKIAFAETRTSNQRNQAAIL
jgi:hypothetical protein